MESEEINSKPIENIELENDEEPQNEEEGNENNYNILVKEENVQKDEPSQEINLVQKNPDENENENEEKEEEIEVEEEVEEEEKENENEEQPQDQKNLEEEKKIELENDEEKEESPMEQQDFNRNQNQNEQNSRGSDENFENEDQSNKSDEEKGQIYEIRMNNSEEKKSTQRFNLNDIEVSATYTEDQNNMNIVFKKTTSSPNLILHWGLYDQYPINKWYHPNKESYPKNTKEFDDYALETGFVDDEKESTIELELPKNDAKGISFVFYNPNINQWYNNNLKDFQIRFSN